MRQIINGVEVGLSASPSQTTTSTTPYTPITDTTFIDSSAGAKVVNLAAGIAKKRFYIANKGNGGYTVTINPNGSEKISRATSVVLYDNEAILIEHDGTDWWVISSTPLNTFQSLDIAFLGQPFV